MIKKGKLSKKLVDDFIEVTKKELSVPVMWILRALTRLTNWFADR